MINFTVNPHLEFAYNWYLHGVGFVVLPLNLFTFYLIYTKNPKNSHRYRLYVLHIQFWTTLLDMHIGILCMPMLLFPLYGGYCHGLLCQVGLPMHYSIALLYFFICGIHVALGMSIFYRHQLILPDGHWLKIGRTSRWLLFVLVTFSMQLPAITLMLARWDQRSAKEYLAENHPAMMWLTEKDNWVVYDAFSYPIAWVNTEAAVLVFVYPIAYFTISFHLYHGIAKANFMSLKTRNLHKHIVTVLITQVCAPFILLMLPIPVFIYSMLTESISHEVNLLCFELILLYSWTHSLILIATTPSYRAVVTSRFRFAQRSSDPLL